VLAASATDDENLHGAWALDPDRSAAR
jgi:hypothetical protein